MKTLRILLTGLLVTIGTWTTAARAADQPLEFLRGLQSKDYGDIAVDYLKMLQEKGAMPDAMREVWDLEMSKSLRASASRAFDAKDYERLMAEAQTFLNKFLKEKPDHPEAMSAMVSWGNFTMDRALNYLRTAKVNKDKEQRRAQYEAARAALEDARPKFEKAIPKFQQRLAGLPPAPASLKTREDRAAMAARDTVEKAWLEARFQLGLCDYYKAQTYEIDRAKLGKPKPKPAPAPAKAVALGTAKPGEKPTAAKPGEKPAPPPPPTNEEIFEALLKRAALAFDDIYQTNRVDRFNRVNVIGLYAHMWNGRVVDEMGDQQLALDIYDEVLANAGEGGMEDLFTQVEYFRMLIVAKRATAQAFLTEAVEWLRTNEKNAKDTDGYQGIAVEVVKKCIEVADKVDDKQKYLSNARKILADVVRIRGSHQAEAIMLRRKLTGAETDVSQVPTFDEAMAMGDTALQAEQWKDAAACYARAMELSAKVKDQERVKTVKDRWGAARLKLALASFNEGKVNDAYQEAGKLVKEYEGTPISAAAASVAVQAALRMFATSPPQERADALARVENVAKFIEEKWPGKPEADDARVARGQTCIVRGNIEEAIAVFEKVNPKSERYPVALHWSGVTHWRRSLMERQKPENQRNKPQMEADRTKAAERFQQSLELQKKTLEADKALPQQMIDTQLALGEIRLDEGKPKEAVELFAPLVEAKKSAKAEGGEGVDTATLRIFVGAVQAYTAINDFDKAAGVGQLLLELGPDMEPINRVLVEFAKLVHVEWQKAEAAVTEAKDAKVKAAAQKKRADVAKLLGNLLKQLSARQNNTPAGMVYIADRCAEIGMNAEAKDQYQKIKKRVERGQADQATEKERDFARSASRAMTRVSAQLIGLLRMEADEKIKQDKKDEAQTLMKQALEEANTLVKNNPRSLEPRMEQARILQKLAELETTAERCDEAAKKWTALRNLLQGVAGKKPPEIFECTYGAAFCLYGYAEAKKGTDKADAVKRAGDGEKLLKATLILSPSLSGPDMVAKYNELLGKITTFLGR